MVIKKCDICGKDKTIRTFPRSKLREEKLQVVRSMGIKSETLTKTWKHPNLAKLEQTNPGFKRKSRICKDCVKETELKK